MLVTIPRQIRIVHNMVAFLRQLIRVEVVLGTLEEAWVVEWHQIMELPMVNLTFCQQDQLQPTNQILPWGQVQLTKELLQYTDLLTHLTAQPSNTVICLISHRLADHLLNHWDNHKYAACVVKRRMVFMEIQNPVNVKTD